MQNRTKFIAIINLAVVIMVIFWNYYANTGIINDNTVGSLSDKYNSFFTPAGFIFAIWGIIYLGLIYQARYALYCAFKSDKNDDFILTGIPWIILANITNGLWLWFWLTEQIGISVLLLFLITAFLLIAVLKLKMEKWNAPVTYMAGVWWPLDIYVGWGTVAAIANTAIYLKVIGWDGFGINEVHWTMIMIAVATALNLFMVYTRNMREFAAVGIWAIMGIASRHWGVIEEIQWTAVSCSAVLLIATLIHTNKNKDTWPIIGSNSKWK